MREAAVSDFMNTREVAAYLRIKERKVYDLVARKEIPRTRVGGKWLFPKADIDAWLAASLAGGRSSPAPPKVVAGSHDPLLDWALRESGSGLAFLAGGSLLGLDAMAGGRALAAGLHVFAGDGGTYNVPAVKAALAGRPVVMIRWADRQQCLIIAKGNPLAITSMADLKTKGARLITRQAGAGSQILLEFELARAGLDLAGLATLPTPAGNETELARAVAQGKADAGVGVRTVAEEYGLDFIALRREKYDLVVGRREYFEPPFQALLAFAGTDVFRSTAGEMPGYDVSGLGGVVFNGP
jgi:excisionase family DNA binding protein